MIPDHALVTHYENQNQNFIYKYVNFFLCYINQLLALLYVPKIFIYTLTL